MTVPNSRRSESATDHRLRRLDEALTRHYVATQGDTQIDLGFIRQEADRRNRTAQLLGVKQGFTITVNRSHGRLVITMPTRMIYAAKTVLSVFAGLLVFVTLVLAGQSSMVATLCALFIAVPYFVTLPIRRPRRIEEGRLRGLQRVKPLIMNPPSAEAYDEKPSTNSA